MIAALGFVCVVAGLFTLRFLGATPPAINKIDLVGAILLVIGLVLCAASIASFRDASPLAGEASPGSEG